MLKSHNQQTLRQLPPSSRRTLSYILSLLSSHLKQPHPEFMLIIFLFLYGLAYSLKKES
jgi:hypothetical protein